jgi:hypothetical protein
MIATRRALTAVGGKFLYLGEADGGFVEDRAVARLCCQICAKRLTVFALQTPDAVRLAATFGLWLNAL